MDVVARLLLGGLGGALVGAVFLLLRHVQRERVRRKVRREVCCVCRQRGHEQIYYWRQSRICPTCADGVLDAWDRTMNKDCGSPGCYQSSDADKEAFRRASLEIESGRWRKPI